MDQKQRDVIELNRLHDEWLEIKKKKLSDEINTLSEKMNGIARECADCIVEMYKLAFEEDLEIQNVEYLSDTREMMISLYAKDGIYQEKADAFAEAFSQRYGIDLVPELYSENEFAFSGKSKG